MLDLVEFRDKISSFREQIQEIGFLFDIEGLEGKIEKLEEKMAKQDFWNDHKKAQKVAQELKNIKDKVKEYRDIINEIEDVEVLLELAQEEEDLSLIDEIKKIINSIDEKVNDIRIKTLLNEEYDKNNAILSIHSGAGGLEAQDWAQMLLRMYRRWCERKGYDIQVLDILPDPEAGIKSVTLLVKGLNAYGYLKSEKGVHRLVRISPFDSSGRRHTSFASVDVVPEIEDEVDIEIAPNEIRIDTYRASGAGGQHVNKTESAVRITHIPTGIVVQCQNERSQHSNKATAMKILKAKLVELERLKQKEKIEGLQGEYNQIAWGSQIRSYIFHPYNLVKDHRTGAEVGNVNSVMDGDIDLFINEYLKSKTR
ncbi:peptide chain release factor 2 [Caloranaerobacter azorensis]|uniref:Peptide chain release factor 2 n=1 Tax=Caloranaerobacter azorensis TaxID=116090 RepID=A0A6P1YFG2_9FIRM|nr:peptide chain release factor 2 [Caloranaerobacter azorensis]QIB27478.1 peptide chain release factor 2 [Caloranaerobacter azorensis]